MVRGHSGLEMQKTGINSIILARFLHSQILKLIFIPITDDSVFGAVFGAVVSASLVEPYAAVAVC